MARDAYFDSLKGLLIVSVVIGHVVAPLVGDNKAMIATEDWIYSFHMPLFVFVSGYFSTTSGIKVKHQVIRLLETYIVCQLISIYYLYIIQEPISILTFLNPYCLYWYLWCLILWKILLYFIGERFDNIKCLLIIVSITIGLLSGYFPFRAFAVNRFFSLMPFFLTGYYIKKKNLVSKLKINEIVAVFFLIGYFFILIFIPYKLSDIFRFQNGYDDELLTITNRGLAIFVASIISICVMSITHKSYIFNKVGKNTLYIYVYHWWIIRTLSEFRIWKSFEGNLIATMVLSVLVCALAYFLGEIYLFRWIMNPITKKWRR